jgi:hypothetical protein
MNSQVFVFGSPRTPEGEKADFGLRDMAPDDKFVIATINHPHKAEERIIPFFSSRELLQRAARGANLPPQATFLGFHALNLLKLAKGMGLPLVLNLGPMTYKIFNADEIDFLLASVRQKLYEDRQLPAGSQVALAPPEVYPQELVGALLDFLPGLPEVRAAYLTTLKEEAAEESAPGLVIGLETEEGAEVSEMLQKIALLVARHAPKGQSVDFTQVRPGEKGLSQLLLAQVNPFYRRALPGQIAPAAPAEPAAQTQDDGLFGRLKRIFKG